MDLHPLAGTFLRKSVISKELRARVDALELPDEGHGYDSFGMNREWVAGALVVTRFLYERWFRVESSGVHHLPASGAAVLAANHSGALPLDALMIWTDIVRKSEPPRAPRVVVDHFVNLLPVLNVLFTRAGATGGSRANFHETLEGGDLVLVFPEGVPGIGKPFSKRYQLARWREGHAELAIRHGVPVVPIAVIGAEEQMPQLGRIDGINFFGTPYLPICVPPLPLPVRYHIHYGAPIPLHEQYKPKQATDPDVLQEAAAQVEEAVKGLISKGLALRKGVFR